MEEIRNSSDTRHEAVVFSVSGTKMILDNAFVSMDLTARLGLWAWSRITRFDNIKAKIQDATGISFAKMTLIYNGAAVQDSYTLNDYNIQSGYALNLLTRDREQLIGYMGHLVHLYHHLNVEARQTAKKYPVGSSQWQALRNLSDQASALANRVRVDAELPLLR